MRQNPQPKSVTLGAKGLRAWIPGLISRRRDTGLHSPRFWLLAVGHLILFSLIYWTAYVLRFLPVDTLEYQVHFWKSVPLEHQVHFWNSLPWLLGVKFVVFYASGHYHGWWRYVTFSDLTALMRASLVSFLALAAVDYLVSAYFIPRGVLVLDAMLSIVVLGALRASWRLGREQFRSLFGSHDRVGVLVVGTDDTTALLAHQIQSHPESTYRVRRFSRDQRRVVARSSSGPDSRGRARTGGGQCRGQARHQSHPDAIGRTAGSPTACDDEAV